LTSGKAPPPHQEPPQKEPEDADPELEDDDDLGNDDLDDGLGEDDDLGNDNRDGDLGDDEAPPNLPPLRRLGDRTGPPKEWLIKGLAPKVGTGLLGGRRSAGKTFVAIDFAGSMMTGRPFLNHMVKRQSGVLWLAAEGQDEVELRLEALIREKYGQMPHAEVPFRWRETVPRLLERGATEQLIAIAQQAEADLTREHGLPLGVIIVDTITSCAGYSHRGDENDNAVASAMTLVLQTIARTMGCFVLAVAHLSDTGIRGGKSKEEITDVIWACLSDHEFGAGPATNTRLVVEKNRGGRDGMVFPYTLRLIEAPE
jgi:AAA domain